MVTAGSAFGLYRLLKRLGGFVIAELAYIDSNWNTKGVPLTGSPAAGKTTLRKQMYETFVGNTSDRTETTQDAVFKGKRIKGRKQNMKLMIPDLPGQEVSWYETINCFCKFDGKLWINLIPGFRTTQEGHAVNHYYFHEARPYVSFEHANQRQMTLPYSNLGNQRYHYFEFRNGGIVNLLDYTYFDFLTLLLTDWQQLLSDKRWKFLFYGLGVEGNLRRTMRKEADDHIPKKLKFCVNHLDEVVEEFTVEAYNRKAEQIANGYWPLLKRLKDAGIPYDISGISAQKNRNIEPIFEDIGHIYYKLKPKELDK
jgi:hypothetical protein